MKDAAKLQLIFKITKEISEYYNSFSFPIYNIIRCRLECVLIFVKSAIKIHRKCDFSSEKFCWFGKSSYLCTR